MKKKNGKISEEKIYETYLEIRRKEEEARVRDRLLKKKYGRVPDKEKARTYLASEEYRTELQAYFSSAAETAYLFLPAAEQDASVIGEYRSLKKYIEKDLEVGKRIRGIDHYLHLLKKEEREMLRSETAGIVEAVRLTKKGAIFSEIRRLADVGFRKKKLYYYREVNGWPDVPMAKEPLTPDWYPYFFEQLNLLFNIAGFLRVPGNYTYVDTPYAEFVTDWIIRHTEGMSLHDRELRDGLCDAVTESDLPGELIALLVKEYCEGKARKLVSGNRQFRVIRKEYERREAREAALRATILETIPEKYMDMFPLARSIRRKFVIHTGPTNSGKTHDAVRRMVQARNGVYLGPLRLMAYEQYETISTLAGKCTMITGEEEITEPGSVFTSSTIEMLDTDRHYECAVIDEAQMIGDPSRGGSWTKALYGLYADEIQVCTAPEALDLLIRIIEDCGDAYRVVTHERFTPLIAEETVFPSNLKEASAGDALIVFSRRSVHAVAAELQRMNRTVSIIYGSLPYDVRHNEARKFAEGETEILVATDAVGMGMNLPIRRVVFLEQQKFDGYEKRFLKSSEILQIAGRAGRRGLYDIGYAASAGEKKRFLKLFATPPAAVEKAYVSFPEILLTLDCPLSEALERWKNFDALEDLLKGDTDDQIALAKAAEGFMNDKELIYKLVCIPFDIRTAELWDTWTDLVRKEASGTHCDLSGYLEHAGYTAGSGDIALLETEYKRMDLLYGYSRQVSGNQKDCEAISLVRRSLSDRIITVLSEQKLMPKKCMRCGRELPWNYPFRLCGNCYVKNKGYMYG